MRMLFKSLCAVAMLSFVYTAQSDVLSMGQITNVTTQDQLDRIIYENKYVIVQFLNPKCPVCRAFKRDGIFAHLAEKYPRVRFVEVDSELAPALHEKYNITGTPTFIFFKNTENVSTLVGRVNQGSFEKKLLKVFGLKMARD